MFNGCSELNRELGINLYETSFRSLDPQLGRFWQSDPLADQTPDISLYAFLGNNPLAFLDPMGLKMQPWNGTGEDFWQWFYHAGNGDQIYYDPDIGLEEVTIYGKWRSTTGTESLNALKRHEEDLALAHRNAEEFERQRAKGDMTVNYVRPPVEMMTQQRSKLFESLVDINSNLKKLVPRW